MVPRTRTLVTVGNPMTAPAGDAEMLEFAVYNLVSNAVKYSPERTAVRVVSSRRDGEAVIEVSDQGPGISKEEAAHIFQRFYRTEEAERSDKPGYGLGLMFVQEIVKHHGGAVSVRSEVGKGSVFTVSIPNRT